MAMKERYYTIDGQMIGYKDASGRKDFLTDALGSVTAEVEQTGATKTFDGRYKPYGGDLSSTGTRGSYGWVGTWGYRGTGLAASSHYVRARHYSLASAIWTTIDSQWPREKAYNYVNDRVTVMIDQLGLQGCNPLDKWMSDFESHLRKLRERYFPDPPSTGKGERRYNPTINPITFKYGNCCGNEENMCGKNSTLLVVPPRKDRPLPKKGAPVKYDCLDAACKQHDIDIPDWQTYMKPEPHSKLCSAVQKCDCAEMYQYGYMYFDCIAAKNDLIIYACSSEWFFTIFGGSREGG